MIDQNYLQCHFFGSQTKDKVMHKNKPQSGRMYRIGEAARALNLQTSVLRFWEGEFPELQPVRTPKGQRLYTERDMEILHKIRSLLHEQGMTIEGARRVLSGGTVPGVLRAKPEVAAPTPPKHDSLAVSNENRAILEDALRELRELRAFLTMNNAEEIR